MCSAYGSTPLIQYFSGGGAQNHLCRFPSQSMPASIAWPSLWACLLPTQDVLGLAGHVMFFLCLRPPCGEPLSGLYPGLIRSYPGLVCHTGAVAKDIFVRGVLNSLCPMLSDTFVPPGGGFVLNCFLTSGLRPTAIS